jgi:hypothetical protein
MSRSQVGLTFGGPSFLCSIYFLTSFYYSFIVAGKQPLGIKPLFS